MIDRHGLELRLGGGPIGAGPQDVVETAPGSGAQLQGIVAGGVEAFRLVAAGQPENAVAGAEAELRVGVALHDRGDEGVDMGADIPGLLLQPGAGVLDAGALVRPGWKT